MESNKSTVDRSYSPYPTPLDGKHTDDAVRIRGERVSVYFVNLVGSVSRNDGIEVMEKEVRRGKNTRHLLTGLLRQSVFGRLAGYEDVNDAERLASDPVMRAIADRKGLEGMAASRSQMGRFETT